MPAPPLYRSDADIAVVGRGLLDRTLPHAAWSHAGHFAAAFWLLATRPLSAVPRELEHAIRTYNPTVGIANTDTTGYHETITQASLRAANAFLHQVPGRPLHAACNALLASPLGRSAWLLTFWSRPRLSSTEARYAWLPPDLQPLPYPDLTQSALSHPLPTVISTEA